MNDSQPLPTGEPFRARLTRRELVVTAAGSLAVVAGCKRPAAGPTTPTEDHPVPNEKPRLEAGRVFDAVVVGGSFAGLAAALQLARARRAVLLFDAGKPRNRFARHSHGFLGQDGRTPAEIVAEARRQLMKYPTVQFVAVEAKAAARDGDEFKVAFDGGEARGRRLVLATGVVDHLPDVPGLSDRWGEGVLHCPYCHGYEVAGRRLGVLASSEHSLHQAKLVPDWGDDVTLFTNGTVVLSADDRAALTARNVKVVDGRVTAVRGAGRAIEAVTVDGAGVVPIDALFVGPRTTLASPLAEQLGCEVEAGRSGPVVKTDATKETTVKGVYAAGDAARALHNATWAAADGVTAGVSAHQSLVFAADPRQKGK